jgi:hypothetical protein
MMRSWHGPNESISSTRIGVPLVEFAPGGDASADPVFSKAATRSLTRPLEDMKQVVITVFVVFFDLALEPYEASLIIKK